jgi:hypothetical protein
MSVAPNPTSSGVESQSYDSDDYEESDLIEKERDTSTSKHPKSYQGGNAIDGCIYLAVHIVLMCLAFAFLSLWLSYGPDECPSF